MFFQGLALLIWLCLSETGKWTVKSNDAYALEGAAAAYCNGFIYIIGGKNNDTYNVNFYRTNTSFSGTSTLLLPDGYTSASYSTLTNVGSGLLLVGGEYNGTVLSKVYFFSPSTGWDNISRELPDSATLQKHCAASIPSGEYVLIYGGINNKSVESNTLYICRKSLSFVLTHFLSSILPFTLSFFR